MINEVTLLGYVGGEPSVRVSGAGKEVMQLSLATEYSRKDAQGQWQKKTTWHNLVLWSPSADQKTQVHKGSLLFVKGRINMTENEKDGKKFKNFDITVEKMKVLNRDSKAGTTGGDEDFPNEY